LRQPGGFRKKRSVSRALRIPIPGKRKIRRGKKF